MPYFLPEGYEPRYGATQDFEGENTITDNCQAYVYKEALRVAKLHDHKSIADVGAGGGWKLVNYFKGYELTGFDLPTAVAILKKKYPTEAKWQTADEPYEDYDLVICSDVIEHVDNPNELCEFIKTLNPKHVVFSTPNRDQLIKKFPDTQLPLGPPRNQCHVMEWNMGEFQKLIKQHFDLENAFLYPAEYGMCIVGRSKC